MTAAGIRSTSTRATRIGGSGLVAALLLYGLANKLLAPESFAQTLVSDLGFVLVQLVVLTLCLAAYLRTRATNNSWIWLWFGSWVGLNFLADSIWAYYEVGREVEVPFPGVADVFYLASYAAAFAGVLFVAQRCHGHLWTWETALDGLIIATGALALLWPFFLKDLFLNTSSPAEFWVSLTYVAGDILIIASSGSLLLGTCAPHRKQQPYSYVLIFCIAVVIQLLADFGYFYLVATGRDYSPGSLLDPVWLLGFAMIGLSCLRALGKAGATSSADDRPPGSERAETNAARTARAELLRSLMPVTMLIMLTSAVVANWAAGELPSDYSTNVFLGFCLMLVILIFLRQHLDVTKNFRLTKELAHAHAHLQKEVDQLASLNQRLGELNHHLERIQRMRTVPQIANEALELACAWEGSPGGWIELLDEHGKPYLAASWGIIGGREAIPRADPQKGASSLRTVVLETGGQRLGTMHLVNPDSKVQDVPQVADTLPAIALHVATAMDNARRYEEAVYLAERDPLTGLYNYRGIHKRLAEELLRAQQKATELSVVMIDLDNFKPLNDTYGHSVGDHILRQVADAIRGVLRHTDLAARIGGDELLLVLPNTGAVGAERLAERLLETVVEQPYLSLLGEKATVRMSIGIATYPADALTIADLLHVADQNMYASKQRGGHTATSGPLESPLGNKNVQSKNVRNITRTKRVAG